VIAALARRLERRMKLEVSVSGGHLYVNVGSETLRGEIRRFAPEG